MLALWQIPFPSLAYSSFESNRKRRNQQNHKKQNRMSQVMYTLYSIYLGGVNQRWSPFRTLHDDVGKGVNIFKS